MHKSLIVLDDFLDNIDEVRATALQLQYGKIRGFPGELSHQPVQIEGTDAILQRRLGEALEPHPDFAHARFHLTGAGDMPPSLVKVDSGCIWTGLLFLNPDCRDKAGVDFFRHRPTGSDRTPINAQEISDMGFASYREMLEQTIIRDGNESGKWERSMTVPAKYNRLILFRSWMWHAPGAGFGSSLADGQLTWLLFYRWPAQ